MEPTLTRATRGVVVLGGRGEGRAAPASSRAAAEDPVAARDLGREVQGRHRARGVHDERVDLHERAVLRRIEVEERDEEHEGEREREQRARRERVDLLSIKQWLRH